MIEQCDPLVASWSTDGNSFIIRDVDSFSKVSLVACWSVFLITSEMSIRALQEQEITIKRPPIHSKLVTDDWLFHAIREFILSFYKWLINTRVFSPCISNIPSLPLSLDSLTSTHSESFGRKMTPEVPSVSGRPRFHGTVPNLAR